MSLESLPHLNATLNTTSALLLCLGYHAIRHGRKTVHARFMVAAFLTSLCFLASYLVYHYHVGHTTYSGEGLAKGFYLTVLLTHIVLAIVTLPLAATTLFLAATRRWAPHKRLARWTFPIWLYVSATGVVVYLMLYHFCRPPPVREGLRRTSRGSRASR